MHNLILVLATFFLLLTSMPAQAEKSVWHGPYLSYGRVAQVGNHDFTLSHERWGSHELWAFPVSGSGRVIEAGYRWQVGQSKITVGPTVSLMKGTLFGEWQWQHVDTGAEMRLSYESKIQATAGIELGYIVSEHVLVTAEAGFVTSDARLMLSGAYGGYKTESGIEGYVPGEYVSLGVNYQFPNGATLGAEVGHYWFAYKDQWGSVNGNLSTDATVVSLKFGFQF